MRAFLFFLFFFSLLFSALTVVAEEFATRLRPERAERPHLPGLARCSPGLPGHEAERGDWTPSR